MLLLRLLCVRLWILGAALSGSRHARPQPVGNGSISSCFRFLVGAFVSVLVLYVPRFAQFGSADGDVDCQYKADTLRNWLIELCSRLAWYHGSPSGCSSEHPTRSLPWLFRCVCFAACVRGLPCFFFVFVFLFCFVCTGLARTFRDRRLVRCRFCLRDLTTR